MVRWVAAGILEATKGFRRLQGKPEMPKFVAALRARDQQLGLGDSGNTTPTPRQTPLPELLHDLDSRRRDQERTNAPADAVVASPWGVHNMVLIHSTDAEIDRLAGLLNETLNDLGAEDLDYARLVLALKEGGPVMRALRSRFSIDNEKAARILRQASQSSSLRRAT